MVLMIQSTEIIISLEELPKSNNRIYKREGNIGKGIKGGIISSKEGLGEGLLCDISFVTLVGVLHQTFQKLTPILSNSAI